MKYQNVILVFLLILSSAFAQFQFPPFGNNNDNPTGDINNSVTQQPTQSQPQSSAKEPSATKDVGTGTKGPTMSTGIIIPNMNNTTAKVPNQSKQVTITQPNAPAQTQTQSTLRTGENGTPIPVVQVEEGDTATHSSKQSGGGGVIKFVLIGGGVIAALVVVGVVMNFINKQKNKGKDPMGINFVVQDPANEEPKMSTSMFSPQQNANNYQEYNLQYGQQQYDQAYSQPPPAATSNYDNGYQYDIPPPPENPNFNYNQRTLSLNRQPSGGAARGGPMNGGNAREVIYNHRPEAGDEIELRRGDQAEIYEKYEDGWAWGFNITTGKTGMFPQQCLN